MVSLQLPPMAPQGGTEGVFSSPPVSTDPSSWSLRPSKKSNIRVVTRIRPLLDEERAVGRKAAILPLQLLPQPQENTRIWPRGDPADEITTPRNCASLKSIPLPSSNRRNDSDTPKTPSSFSSSSFDFLKTSIQQTTPTSNSPPTTSVCAGFSPTSTKQFDFDAVLGMDSTQEQAYETAVGDKILNHVFRGINFTIMAYGQTSSGKTYTMQGFREGNLSLSREIDENHCPNNGLISSKISADDGIIPRAIHDLFKGKMDYKASGKGGVSMELTYFELYNDEIRDLLSEEDEFRALKMLDQGEGGIIIEGLTTVPIDSAEQVHDLIRYAAERRATASTNANSQSSRSHAICTLTVRTSPSNNVSTTSISSDATQAKLTLVDLAGSERIKKTGVSGQQQQESITINKDLFVLGKVVSALADKSRSASKGKQLHIPFRDSKLTRLLRESLGGNCFTVLISCVSPADIDLEESINTLRYAERARSISNSLKRNMAHSILSPAECASLQAENKLLKQEVSKWKTLCTGISRDMAGSLLDQEEGQITSDAPIPVKEPAPKEVDTKEVFRLAAQTACQKQERPQQEPTPVWMHFRNLAKYSGDVVTQDNSRSKTRVEEVELKEISSSDNGNDKCQSKNRRDPSEGPESCLAYEMSLYPSHSDDLVGYEADEPKDNEQKKSPAKLENKYNVRLVSIEDLKAESSDLEASLRKKQEELVAVSSNVEVKEAVVANLLSNQTELEKLVMKIREALVYDQTKKDELDEESSQLDHLVEPLTRNNFGALALADPQKNFRSIEYEASRRLCDNKILEILRQVGEFPYIPKQKDEMTNGITGSNTNAGTPDAPEEVSNLIDMAARIEEHEAKMMDLEKRLMHEKRTRQEQDRTMAIKDAQIEWLGERLSDLGTHLEIEKSQKINNRNEVTILQAQIQCLEERVKEEKLRSTNLGTRNDYLRQEYDSTTANLQEKISSLLDQAKTDNHLHQRDYEKLKTDRDDLEYQVAALKKNVEDLEDKLQSERNQKKDLRKQAHTFEEKAATLEADLKRGQVLKQQEMDSMNESYTNQVMELQDKLSHLSKEKKDMEDMEVKKDAKMIDASTSTSSDGLAALCIKEDAHDALLQIVASTSGDWVNGDEGENPRSELSRPSPNSIRMQAEKLLLQANESITKANCDSSIAHSSALSSAGTYFIPSLIHELPPCPATLKSTLGGKPPMAPKVEDNKVHITNLDVMDKDKKCTCTSDLFASNAEYVEFYLPKIHVDCTCGKMPRKKEYEENENPCALASILRPWQVEFLASLNIADPVSLVHACNQRGGLLAKSLRRWRKRKGMASIRTRSCSVALHIWSRTCKSVVRSVRTQQAQGVKEPKRPDFLELNISEDKTAVSSLGGGSFKLL